LKVLELVEDLDDAADAVLDPVGEEGGRGDGKEVVAEGVRDRLDNRRLGGAGRTVQDDGVGRVRRVVQVRLDELVPQ
jgi:hypothetical protein